jgi:hypothetical protein
MIHIMFDTQVKQLDLYTKIPFHKGIVKLHIKLLAYNYNKTLNPQEIFRLQI